MLDLDATDDPLHGHQEGRFFHGYYDSYCYLPLYIFCGRHLLAAKLRRSNIDGVGRRVEGAGAHRRPDPGQLAAGADPAARRLGLRPREPDGVVRGKRRGLRVRPGQERAAGRGDRVAAGTRPRRRAGGPASRRARFKDFRYTTLESWSRRAASSARPRWTQGEANPRFIVTSLSRDRGRGPSALREDLLRPRRDGEPHQGMPARPVRRPHLGRHHAGQPAAAVVASMAYVLLCALRRIGLRHTQFAEATCGTIRLKLFKIGAS